MKVFEYNLSLSFDLLDCCHNVIGFVGIYDKIWLEQLWLCLWASLNSMSRRAFFFKIQKMDTTTAATTTISKATMTEVELKALEEAEFQTGPLSLLTQVRFH